MLTVTRISEAKASCQRCLSEKPAWYRVTSDLLDIVVCGWCAEQVAEVRLQIENALPETTQCERIRA